MLGIKFWLLISYYLSVIISNEVNGSWTANLQTLRIIRSYSTYLFLHCPLTSQIDSNDLVDVNQIKWVNEQSEFNKPDENVLADSYLIDSSKLELQVNDGLMYVSCGYFYNNKYIRLKTWQLIHIDNPQIQISIRNNPLLTNYAILNDSFSSIGLVNDLNTYDWTKPYDLQRVKCQNNFDFPINQKYVWMYLYNPSTCLFETWHKYDFDENENNYQIFYNPNSNKNATLSEFLRYVFTENNFKIVFQCAAYYERYLTRDKIYLLASSKNITVIKGDYFPPLPLPTPQAQASNNGALIGGIIGGILGFLLLLALILLLIFCCCCPLGRKRKGKINRTEDKTKTMIVPVLSSSNNNNNNNINTINNVQTISNNRIDQESQFTNQIEIANLNTDEYGFERNSTSYRTTAPDVYLTMLTVHKDPSEESVSISNHRRNEISQYDGSTTGHSYLADRADDIHRQHQFQHQHQLQHQYHHTHTNQFIHNYKQEHSSETDFQYL